MIELVNKEKCTGCSACYNICPKNAIKMKEDKEGFKYPIIDKEKCIECGLCKNTCSVIKKEKKKVDINELEVVAAYSKNEIIRKTSSSGGIFTEIAKTILKDGGVIFGAGYDEHLNVIHKKAENEKELEELKGSKYVQSSIGTTYKEAKNILEKGKKTLYVGTPCQIVGLKEYLQKDYEQLYTCDVICHGSPSPKLLRKYIEEREIEGKYKVKKIYFRDKTYGWNQYSLKFEYENNQTNLKNLAKDSYMQLFLKNFSLRPSCYKCDFKNTSSIADISLGDFWGVEHRYPEFSDNKGTSIILINSKKGKELFDNIKNNLVYRENCDIEYIIKTNPCIAYPVKENPLREEFFNDVDKMNFEALKNKYIPQENKVKVLLKRIKNKIVSIIKSKNN